MSANYRKQAKEILRVRREGAESAAEKRYSDALLKYPDLQKTAVEISNASVESVRAAFAGGRTAEKANANRAARTAEFDALLKKHGLSREDFKPKYSCPFCDDTGYVGQTVCKCLTALESNLAQNELAADAPLMLSSFDDFDLSYYPDEARVDMETIFDYCRDYAETFSRDSESIFMFGATGLGKTHLSLAIAKSAVEKDYAVIYGSAGNLLSKVEREHFSGSGETTFDSLLGCDLLVLDDLGTEFGSQFNLSAVYGMINGRLLSSRPTIISTNLSLDEIKSRYGDRVLSRIAGSYSMFRFSGRDIRIAKKKENG